MSKRKLLKAGLGVIAAPWLVGRSLAQPAKPAQIVVNDSGGATQAANRKTFYTAFEKQYGIKIVNTSPVDLGKLRAMVQSGNVELNRINPNDR